MSGVPMPNFMNVGPSLRRELNEEEDDDEIEFDNQWLSTFNDLMARNLHTPDLIIEEESDSELSESSIESTEEKSKISMKYQSKICSNHIVNLELEHYWSTESNQKKLIACQSFARTWFARKEYNQLRHVLNSPPFISVVTHIQGHIRGNAVRAKLFDQRAAFAAREAFIIRLQTIARGYIARCKYRQTIEHYTTNIDKVVKVQNFVKNKLQGTAYRKLTNDTNPSLSTVKSFIHLLDDSDLDFDRELALEDLRQQVIENIRKNNQLDAHINILDIQIALFLKNAISIDEVLKHSGAFKKKKEQQRIISEMAAKNNQANPFSFTAIDKESRCRLELYQQLIYLLQTEPKYLARLLSMTNRQDLGDYSSHKLIESTVLSLFGYATNAREEYLLINLCKVRFLIDTCTYGNAPHILTIYIAIVLYC